MNRFADDTRGPLDWRAGAIVGLAGAAVLGVNLGGASLTNHAVFAAEPAVEML